MNTIRLELITLIECLIPRGSIASSSYRSLVDVLINKECHGAVTMVLSEPTNIGVIVPLQVYFTMSEYTIDSATKGLSCKFDRTYLSRLVYQGSMAYVSEQGCLNRTRMSEHSEPRRPCAKEGQTSSNRSKQELNKLYPSLQS
jgi:hypothetical protein